MQVLDGNEQPVRLAGGLVLKVNGAAVYDVDVDIDIGRTVNLH